MKFLHLGGLRRVGFLSAILVTAAPIGRSQNPSIADLADADFKSLAEKTNLYVKALNATASVQRSYDRYASWVDVKKGPTGKERYIDYSLYEISRGTVDEIAQAATKGPDLRPLLPDVDAAVQKLARAATALAPLVKNASDYYEQQDYKDDGAKRGQELHRQMMPLFEQVFSAEAALRRGLDSVKAEVDRRQLAQIEKQHGKNYEWHLRSFMMAAKTLADLVPASAGAPAIEGKLYNARFAELDAAYKAFTEFCESHPDEVKKVLMASFVESAVKDFFGASKFLRRVLEAPKPNKQEYITKVNDLVQKYNDLIQRTNSLR